MGWYSTCTPPPPRQWRFRETLWYLAKGSTEFQRWLEMECRHFWVSRSGNCQPTVKPATVHGGGISLCCPLCPSPPSGADRPGPAGVPADDVHHAQVRREVRGPAGPFYPPQAAAGDRACAPAPRSPLGDAAFLHRSCLSGSPAAGRAAVCLFVSVRLCVRWCDTPWPGPRVSRRPHLPSCQSL